MKPIYNLSDRLLTFTRNEQLTRTDELSNLNPSASASTNEKVKSYDHCGLINL